MSLKHTIVDRLYAAESSAKRYDATGNTKCIIYLGLKEHMELKDFVREYLETYGSSKAIEEKIDGKHNRLYWRGMPVYLINAGSHLNICLTE